jgi:hypothetical protein
MKQLIKNRDLGSYQKSKVFQNVKKAIMLITITAMGAALSGCFSGCTGTLGCMCRGGIC